MKSLVLQLETAIVEALEVAFDGAAHVRGFRASVDAGEVKTDEGTGQPVATVTVSPASSASYASPVLEFGVTVRVALSWPDDPTIAAFDGAAAIVERVLMRWNANGRIAEMSAALSTANFRADGFRLDGGTDEIQADAAPAQISSSFNFAVKGTFRETEE